MQITLNIGGKEYSGSVSQVEEQIRAAHSQTIQRLDVMTTLAKETIQNTDGALEKLAQTTQAAEKLAEALENMPRCPCAGHCNRCAALAQYKALKAMPDRS